MERLMHFFRTVTEGAATRFSRRPLELDPPEGDPMSEFVTQEAWKTGEPVLGMKSPDGRWIAYNLDGMIIKKGVDAIEGTPDNKV